jgi:hypothetical protein
MSFWTAEADAQARELWVKGLTGREVAQLIGAPSASAVVARMWRLGLQRMGSSRRRARPVLLTLRSESPIASSIVHPPCRPKPWLAREERECAFPIAGEGADLLSCCNPAARRSSYCPAHRAIVRAAVPPPIAVTAEVACRG